MSLLSLAGRAATGKLVLILAGGLLAAVAGLGGWLWLRGVRLDAAREDVRTLSAQVESLTGSLRGCASANADWESVHQKAVTMIGLCQADLDLIGAQNADALATARQRTIEVQADVDAWRERYRQAISTPACSQVLNLPMCPDLQEDVP